MTIEDRKVQVCQLNVVLAKFPNQTKDSKVFKKNEYVKILENKNVEKKLLIVKNKIQRLLPTNWLIDIPNFLVDK